MPESFAATAATVPQISSLTHSKIQAATAPSCASPRAHSCWSIKSLKFADSFTQSSGQRPVRCRAMSPSGQSQAAASFASRSRHSANSTRSFSKSGCRTHAATRKPTMNATQAIPMMMSVSFTVLLDPELTCPSHPVPQTAIARPLRAARESSDSSACAQTR